MSYEEDDFYREPWSYRNATDKRGLRKAYAHGKHIPNKNEATLLRKIMSESGLSEKEVREHYKYRLLLSTAQKEGAVQKFNKKEKAEKKLMKQITRELKLAKEHPLVVAEFKKRWQEKYSKKNWWY